MFEADARTTLGIIGDADARSTMGIIFVVRKIAVVFGDKLLIVSRTFNRNILKVDERTTVSGTKNRNIKLC